jgi:hypothetical protein
MGEDEIDRLNQRVKELEGEVENGRHWLCCAVMYAGGEITIKDDLSDKAKDYEVMAQPNIDDGLLRVFVRRKAAGHVPDCYWHKHPGICSKKCHNL